MPRDNTMAGQERKSRQKLAADCHCNEVQQPIREIDPKQLRTRMNLLQQSLDAIPDCLPDSVNLEPQQENASLLRTDTLAALCAAARQAGVRIIIEPM